MTAKPRRQPSSTVGRDEVLHDSRGRVIDDDYVAGAVQDAIAYMRGRGRPSLSESGASPMLRVRVPAELDAAVRRAAEDAGQSVSVWIRAALERATRSRSA